MKKYYFISGLPRSGSTLLTAILNQNPNFYSDIASPLQDMLENTITYMSETDYSININSEQRKNVLKSIVDGYYKDNGRIISTHVKRSLIFIPIHKNYLLCERYKLDTRFF